MKKFEKIRRYFWAVLLLILPLFSFSMAWNMVWDRPLPFWDHIHPVSWSVISLAALAAAVSEPRRIICGWRRSRIFRTFVIAGCCCLGAAVLQQVIYGGPWSYFWGGIFMVTLPWAGAALAPELKRLLPRWCIGLFLLLLWTTVRSPLCTGFVGNWNWNFSLLALTFSGVVILCFRSRWRLLAAAAAVSIGVILVFIRFPELSPRGTLAGIIGAAAALGYVMVFRRRERWRYILLAALAGGALFISAVKTPDNADIPNARIQLWRGALDFTLSHCIAGVGSARIESRIPPYMTQDYFLSDFPAQRHPHPHNELLHFWAAFGLAGIFYFFMCIVIACRLARRRDSVGLWLLWGFLFLMIHGQFDVLLATPLAGTLGFLILGTLAGGGFSGGEQAGFVRRRYAVVILLAAGAALTAWKNYNADTAMLEGGKALAAKDKRNALAALNRSINIRPSAQALYMAGKVAFFDFHDPAAARAYFTRIKDELRMPSFLHLNRMLGHIHDVRNEYGKALYYYELENLDYPFSALNAGLRLGVLQRSGAAPEKQKTAEKLFKQTMQMRNLPLDKFPQLLKDPGLDDQPLVGR